MNALPRFAPVIAILALLVLVAIGGSALANNTSTPQVDAETATVQMYQDDSPAAGAESSTEKSTSSSTSGESESPAAQQLNEQPVPEPAPVPAQAPAPAPVPAPVPAYNPAPQVPLNYQYWGDDDDWDDDDYDDDWDDDDWDDD